MALTRFVHDQKIDGTYRLVAIDVDEQMGVCYSISGACIGRISESVRSVSEAWHRNFGRLTEITRHPTAGQTSSDQGWPTIPSVRTHTSGSDSFVEFP